MTLATLKRLHMDDSLHLIINAFSRLSWFPSYASLLCLSVRVCFGEQTASSTLGIDEDGFS